MQTTCKRNPARSTALYHRLLTVSVFCRAEEVIVTTDADVVDRVMQITDGKGAWASINPIGGEASRYLPACQSKQTDPRVLSCICTFVVWMQISA